MGPHTCILLILVYCGRKRGLHHSVNAEQPANTVFANIRAIFDAAKSKLQYLKIEIQENILYNEPIFPHTFLLYWNEFTSARVHKLNNYYYFVNG